MVYYKYGEFTENQINNYKKKLHDKLFWLLLYKDPKTRDEYANVDFYKYFDYVMKEINGINELFNYPDEIIELVSVLEAAWLETLQPNYKYKNYRKLILDAHTLVDQLFNDSKEV